MAQLQNEKLKRISGTALFGGLAHEETQALINGLDVSVTDYTAGQTIAEPSAIQSCGSFMMVLSGIAFRSRYEEQGKRILLDYCLPGEILGSERTGIDTLPESTWLAGSSCSVLKFLSPENAHLPASLNSILESRLRASFAECAARLLRKADILSRGTVREKILTYLVYEMKYANSKSFDIPLNRQELADYLCVDRTTLSSELSSLSAEGALKARKKRFELDPDLFPTGGNLR